MTGPQDGDVQVCRSNRGRWLLLGVGTLMFAYYLANIELSSVRTAARRLSWDFVWAALALNLLPGVFKFWRWRMMLDSRGLDSGGFRGYLAVNASFYLGLVSPGTLGELSRGYVAEAKDTGAATAAVAFEKILDLIALVGLALGAVTIRFVSGYLQLVALGLVVGSVVLGRVLFLRYDNLFTRLPSYLFRRWLDDGRSDGIRRAYWTFYDLAKDRRIAACSLAVSLALWLLTLLQMHLIFLALDWQPSYETTALALFVPYLIGVLSLIPLGFGAFEVGMSEILKRVDSPLITGVGQSGPLLYRVVVTVPLIAIGYLSHLALVYWRETNFRGFSESDA